MQHLPTIGIVLLGLVIVFALFGKRILKSLQRREAGMAIDRFRVQREQLEARFFEMASKLGKPRDLTWLDCDWQSEFCFGRELQSGMLTAFVAVNISFEAVEGGDMEDVEAVSTVRDATALFHFKEGSWGTGGRALFNMNPQTALERLRDQYDPIEGLSPARP